MTERYLEDFEAGQTFRSGRIHIDADRIKSFAAEFDPQPFHLDERAGADALIREAHCGTWSRRGGAPSGLLHRRRKPAETS